MQDSTSGPADLQLHMDDTEGLHSFVFPFHQETRTPRDVSVNSCKESETPGGNSLLESSTARAAWKTYSRQNILQEGPIIGVNTPPTTSRAQKCYIRMQISTETPKASASAPSKQTEQNNAGSETFRDDFTAECTSDRAPVFDGAQSDNSQEQVSSSDDSAVVQHCRDSEKTIEQARSSPDSNPTRTSMPLWNDQTKHRWRDGLGRICSRLLCSSSKPAKCTGCFDSVRAIRRLKLPCDHEYCSPCFKRLVTTAMENECLWPPKCCDSQIPRHIIIRKLSVTQRRAFTLKEKEFATPAKDRWYCMRASCGRWFEPQHGGDDVKCPHCRYRMCRRCRHQQHDPGSWCPEDSDLQATIRTADLHGYRTCYKCFTMIELKSGCRHLTCVCGAQFCYVCGAPWHTCSCTEDDRTERNRRLREQRTIAEGRDGRAYTASARGPPAKGPGAGAQGPRDSARTNSYYTARQRRVEPFVEFARRHRDRSTSGASIRSDPPYIVMVDECEEPSGSRGFPRGEASVDREGDAGDAEDSSGILIFEGRDRRAVMVY